MSFIWILVANSNKFFRISSCLWMSSPLWNINQTLSQLHLLILNFKLHSVFLQRHFIYIWIILWSLFKLQTVNPTNALCVIAVVTISRKKESNLIAKRFFQWRNIYRYFLLLKMGSKSNQESCLFFWELEPIDLC